MSVLNQYITFLKEYKKLLERGVKDVLSSNISGNFIWVDDINDFINSKICTSILPEIFTDKFINCSLIFSLEKPNKPNIEIPKEFYETIIFDEAKNIFSSRNEDQEDVLRFQNSENGNREIEKIKRFKKNKEAYSKLYRAYNDIKNDSNLEIVLSVGFIQYSKRNHNDHLSKTNQHLFHFPLSLEVDSNNVVRISFSESDNPYSDFFFLNNTPIEKEILTNIIDRFESKVSEVGFEYIFEEGFKNLISDSVQKISSSSEFEESITKPNNDFYREDHFKISYSPAINIKQRKPRFFEKLADSIINYSEENKIDAKLFNLLIRDPESKNNNPYLKSNYFKDELFEKNKDRIKSLNAEDDFSVFFPLAYNKEQKQIFENYLKNRLTVVTGPPGTGKSHTIVNILCSLLAQGKRVLVTAQTDKALESLLQKIPEAFDNLIFTKIELENKNPDDPIRFSLENSIDNISKILTEDFHLQIESKIRELDLLKSDYLRLKSKIIRTLESEYERMDINDSFQNLRAFEIVEKFENKESQEWDWIKDELSNEELDNFDSVRDSIFNFRMLRDTEIRYSNFIGLNLDVVLNKLNDFDFNNYLFIKEELRRLSSLLKINDETKDRILNIDLSNVVETLSQYSTSDIVIKNLRDIENLLTQIDVQFDNENFSSNRTFSDLVTNEIKYLNDIETYLGLIENDHEKISFVTRNFKSEFKKISYLETITINGRRSNSKKDISQLKAFIKSTASLNKKFNLLKRHGFNFEMDDKSELAEKSDLLKSALKRANRNKEAVLKIQHNSDLIIFADFIGIDHYNIDEIVKKALLFKSDLDKLKQLENSYNNSKGVLNEIDFIIMESKVRADFSEFLPISKLDYLEDYNSIKERFREILNKLKIELTYSKLKNYLQEIIPKTLDSITSVNEEYITKENFDFASANSYFKINAFLDFQELNDELSKINKKILDIKCKILFDLAKSNFRNKFKEDEITSFLNLLNSYKFDSIRSRRTGIADNAKFQLSVRKKSAQISKKLSCWVMKFNDVLNSVEDEPEMFDCIIVDEASQLNFNSLLLGYYAENMIIVGDSKQTSPDSSMVDTNMFTSVKNNHLTYLGDDIIQIRADTSLFDLAKMVAGTSDLMLREHFRCVPELIEFSKTNFYNNSLRPLKQINSNRLPPKRKFFVKDAYTENKIVQKEIDQIKEFLIDILNDDIYHNKTIGVVSLGLTKHTEKLKDIKEELSIKFGKSEIEKHKIIIEDSPKFQGDERDVMIVSLGVALDFQRLQENQNAKPRAIISDQDEFKKINVALSRAKEQMILFHSVKSEHLQPNDFRHKILNFFYEVVNPLPELILPEFEDLRNKHNVPNPFDSWFEYDIAKDLISNGFSHITPQYKVKDDDSFYNHKLGVKTHVNFRLDLVVHNNGKVVAIECDGDPFHSLPEDVAYDVERQEFLQRVGWKVHRILYSAYKRNRNEEVEKLISFINRNTQIDIQTQNNFGLRENQYHYENEIIEEETEFNNSESLEIQPSTNDSLIGRAVNFQENTLFSSFETENESSENKVLRYFNLSQNGTYSLQLFSKSDCLFSLPIEEKYRNGFLLQCYDNGHINKVYVKTLLEKRLEHNYSNGKNPGANILYLKLIQEDTLIGFKIRKGRDIFFKAHKTENISNREQFQLQGYKIMYQDFDEIEYKIFPKNILNDIKRLIFESFTASGKDTNNKYYESEWKIIKQFMPNLFE
ncbi:MAG: AAA domain-containing protein [Ginsengibacter sp.]